MSTPTNLKKTSIGYVIRQLYMEVGNYYPTNDWRILASRFDGSSRSEATQLILGPCTDTGLNIEIARFVNDTCTYCVLQAQTHSARQIFDFFKVSPNLDLEFVVPMGLEAIATAVARQLNSFPPEKKERIINGEDQWESVEALRKVATLKSMVDEDAFKAAHNGKSISQYFAIEVDSRIDGHKHRGVGEGMDGATLDTIRAVRNHQERA